MSKQKKDGSKFRKQLFHIMIFMLVVVIFLVQFNKLIFVTVHSGFMGVKYKRFSGTVMTKSYGEGLHVLFPWDIMFLYDTKIQEKRDTVDALTKDGLTVSVEYYLHFHPKKDKLPYLHQEVGGQYAEKVLYPETKAMVREIVSRYNPEELYHISRDSVRSVVQDSLAIEVGVKYVDLEDFMIGSITLPTDLANSIEDKLQRKQDALAYEHILAAEEQEITRKKMEASGIKSFVDSTDISFLQWKGLQVTEELSKSENSKVIVIGTGEKDMPIILGGPN